MEGRGEKPPPPSSFVLICSSTVIHVYQSDNGGSSAAPITVVSSTWDRHLQQFMPPRHWHLPLSGDIQLLAAGNVESYEFGEYQPHLVIKWKSSLLIGSLSVVADSFTNLVEITLPASIAGHNPALKLFVEECWITDGPIVVAVCKEVLLVARPWIEHKFPDCSSYKRVDRTKEQSWDAYILSLKDFGDGIHIRTIFCGDLKNFAEPELLMCIQSLPVEDSLKTTLPARSNNEWVYIGLSLHTVSFSNGQPASYEGSPSQLCWWEIPCKSVFKFCNDLLPLELHPDLISCVEFVPANPYTTVTSLSSWPYQSSDLAAVASDLVVGLHNGKLLKSRHGCIIAEVDLRDSPFSLQFAVVAEGQGILLVDFNTMENKVVALSAETLEELQAWTGIQNATAGDLQMLGHEQIVLLMNSKSEHEIAASFNDECFASMQITDLRRSICVDVNGQLHELECRGTAIKDHKSHSLKAIAKSLQLRVEAGLAHLCQLEKQRAGKVAILQSSCQLMQDMVMQHNFFETSTTLSKPSEESGMLSLPRKSRYVEATLFQQGTCGRTWFVIIDIRNVGPRGTVLHNVSLLMTTIQGQITSSSSTVESLSAGEGCKRLVAAVSLSNMPIVTYLPMVNVIASTVVSWDGAGFGMQESKGLSVEVDIENSEKYERNQRFHAEWICNIQVDSMNLTRSSEPENIPLDFRQVAPRFSFFIKARTKEERMLFIDAFQSILQMKLRQSSDPTESKLNDNSTQEFVSAKCMLWADATVLSIGDIHGVTLRAEDFHHLTALKACLLAKLEDHILVAFPVNFVLQMTVPD
eukprot:c29148_g1_i4 orf=238-2658(-)